MTQIVTRAGRAVSMRWADVVGVVGFAAVAVLLLAFVTRTGLALKPDSVFYLGAAHSLADGQGYTVGAVDGTRQAVVTYPPGYPSVLAGLDLTGIDLLDAARALNLALFGATAGLLYVLLLRTSEAERWAAGLGTAAFVVAPTTLERFGFALSEPLFLFLVVVTILLLDEYLSGTTRSWLIAAAVTSALACSTRYAGVALVATGVAVVVWGSPGDRAARLRVGALFGGAAIAPFLAWSAWSAAQPEESTRFSPGLRLASQRIQNGYGVMAQWLLPEPIPSFVRVPLFGMVLLVTVVFLVLWIRKSGLAGVSASIRSLPPAAAVALFFAVAYAVVMVVNISFIDPVTRADRRTLSPLFLALIVLAAGTIGRWAHTRVTQRVVVAGASAIVALYLLMTLDEAFAAPIRDGYLPYDVLGPQGL